MKTKLKTLKTINVVELTANGECDADILGIRSFPNTVKGLNDARELLKKLFIEKTRDDYDMDEPLTDEEVRKLLLCGSFRNGSYIAEIVRSIK